MEEEELDPTAVLIDDLVGRLARATLEAAQWKTRSKVAEQALRRMAEAGADDEDEE